MPDHRLWGWSDVGRGLTRKQLASFVQAGRARTGAGRAGIIQQEGRLPAAEVICAHSECHSALSRDIANLTLGESMFAKVDRSECQQIRLR